MGGEGNSILAQRCTSPGAILGKRAAQCGANFGQRRARNASSFGQRRARNASILGQRRRWLESAIGRHGARLGSFYTARAWARRRDAVVWRCAVDRGWRGRIRGADRQTAA